MLILQSCVQICSLSKTFTMLIIIQGPYPLKNLQENNGLNLLIYDKEMKCCFSC